MSIQTGKLRFFFKQAVRVTPVCLALCSWNGITAQAQSAAEVIALVQSPNPQKFQKATSGTVTVQDVFKRMGTTIDLTSTTSLGVANVDASSKWENSNPNDVNQGECQSQWQDRLTVNAPRRNGTSGTLTVRVQTVGQLRPVIVPADFPVSSDFGCAIASLTFEQVLFGNRLFKSQTINGRGEPIGPNSTPVLGQGFLVQIPITFGNPYTYRINLRVYVNAFESHAQSFEVTGVGKAFWAGVASVTDSNGATIDDYTLSSDSGTNYRNSLEPKKNLWAAGDDLVANEKDEAAGEAEAVNAKVPEWSYGFRSTAAGTGFTAFTAAQHQNDVGHPDVDGWIPGAGVLVNTGSVPVSVTLGGPGSDPVRPGQLLMQPTATEFAVARWTAPEAGTFNVAAHWVDAETNNGGNGGAAYVVLNGTQIFGGQASGSKNYTGANWPDGGKVGMAPRSLRLSAGDTIDFVVGANGDAVSDLTAFNAVIRRAPAVTISAPATAVAGEDVMVTVNSPDTLTGVALRKDGMNVGTDKVAPFEFVLKDLTPGIYQLQAEGLADGVLGASNVLTLTVNDAAGAKPAHAGVNAISATGSTYECITSGTWNQADIWRRKSDNASGIPGPDDVAILPDSVEVVLDSSRTVKKLFASGRLAGETGNTNRELTVTGQLSTAGQMRDLTINIPAGAVLTNVKGSAFFENVKVSNQGEMVVTQSLFATGGELTNNGVITLRTSPASGGPVILGAPTVTLAGTVRATPGVAIAGHLIGNDGSTLIGNDGSTLIGNDGSTLIGNDGSTLIGNDGSTLIGNDGSTLIGNDGSTLIGNDGSTLIGNDGSTLGQISAAALVGKTTGASSFRTSQPEGAPQTGATISFNNSIIAGTCNLVGNVTMHGGFITPGASAGAVFVAGNLTLDSSSTMVLEVGGTSANPDLSDQLNVTGTANLDGKLIVKTINGFVPQSGDNIEPLTYGAFTGAFDSISSNAQIAFGAEGATLQISGANPPAPTARNISTRARVETGENVLIAGFIVTGSQPKKVIIRGIGPSLPLLGTLANPILELDGGAVTNDDWRTDQEQEIIDSTIPPTNNLESAIVATLAPGAHTAILRGKSSGTGVGLVEVYDLEPAAPSQLANISSRGKVQTIDDVMIAGFIIGGDYPKKVIVRAIGPALAQYGITGALQNPTLQLVDSNGNSLTNDNWRETQENEIIGSTIPPTNDNEAAIVATLAPGFYTAIVRGKDETTGVALVETYSLD